MLRRATTAFLVLGTCLQLAACQTAGESAGNPAMAVASAAPATDKAAPDEDGEQAASAAAVPSDLAANPAKVKGLTPPLVRAAFGSPSFRRRERGVEVWQYYGQSCVLDLFLYEEATEQRVAHYQLRSRDPGVALDGGCFPTLVKSN